jgi:hypothetical protein
MKMPCGKGFGGLFSLNIFLIESRRFDGNWYRCVSSADRVLPFVEYPIRLQCMTLKTPVLALSALCQSMSVHSKQSQILGARLSGHISLRILTIINAQGHQLSFTNQTSSILVNFRAHERGPN